MKVTIIGLAILSTLGLVAALPAPAENAKRAVAPAGGLIARGAALSTLRSVYNMPTQT